MGSVTQAEGGTGRMELQALPGQVGHCVNQVGSAGWTLQTWGCPKSSPTRWAVATGVIT